jgi:hypothetical protein
LNFWMMIAAGLQHLRAGGREVDLLAQLLEQRQAGVLLQLAHLRGHGRLRQVQLLGGAREAAVAGHRLEHLQLPQGRVAHAPTITSR